MKNYIRLKKIQATIYDKYYGIETMKVVKNDREIYYQYGPAFYSCLFRLFKKYTYNEGDVLVDYGCGKGRVLFVAALCGYKELRGVEINNEIYEIAKQNINDFRFENYSKRINIYNISATDFEFSDDINKVFFYDPFHLKIFIKVFKRIKESLQRKNRKITIFLYLPEKAWIEYLDNYTDFHCIESIDNKYYKFPDFAYGKMICVYSNEDKQD